MRASDEYRSFRVDTATHVLGGLVSRLRPWWIRLASLETQVLEDDLAQVVVKRPVFIAGLARAGSTILLEYLAQHDSVATHRYRDFPMLFTPWWWNRFLDRTPRRADQVAERAHRDGIAVSAESPEAMEEMLWTAFFPTAHDPSESSVLDTRVSHPAFEGFYRDHIRKLLRLRHGSRYVAKNNYHVTRLEYLVKLFPDARIVVPVRDPVTHVASLMKQHRLFCDGERRHRRALQYMRRVGHFEFGLDLRPINAGGTAEIQTIRELWNSGEDARGWARYWAHVHRHLADTLGRNEPLRAATIIVPFEDLCDHPGETLTALSSHCGLSIDSGKKDAFVSRVHYPTYYRPEFGPADSDAIRGETAEVASRFAYAR